jgi:hypothetical protein
MVNSIRVPLDIPINGTPVRLTEIRLPREFGIPFVLVRYSFDGKPQGKPFRLDVQKGVFLDHPEDLSLDAKLQEAIPKILRLLSSAVVNSIEG